MLEIHVIDAFTNRPFRGNPAAVCLLERYPPDDVMQQVAMEMSLSETAFLCAEGDHRYKLRWFTPETEVDLCGHATLASAHYLWEASIVGLGQPISFDTRSGLLTARREEEGWIQLDFPSEPVSQVDISKQMLEALGGGITPSFVGSNRMDLLVELNSEEAVRGLKPNFRAIAALEEVRGMVVTARASSSAAVHGGSYDFVSRCFFPALGISEDPVTGSAHCALAPYWQAKLGKDKLTAVQLSKRTGVLRLQVNGDRVQLSGQAVTVLKGMLQLDLT